MSPVEAYTRREGRHGVVLVTMAVTAAGVFGVVGLAVDIGRVFIAKSEAQVYCDSAALAAALAIDGTTTGIARARTAATATSNKWNFGTSAVPNVTVAFATTSSGPWVANPSPAASYTFARVSATIPVPLYFLPLLTAHSVFSLVSTATAAQVSVTSLSRGIAPYTAVSASGTAPDFGFVAGQAYDIQWPQYNSTRAHCSPQDPDRCFVSQPCAGDSLASKAAVVSNWGANTSGYWGGSSNNEIAAEVLDLIQLAPVTVGANVAPLLTGGNKASEAAILDQRASGDTNFNDNTPTAYLASASHNGRRLMPVIVVRPVSATRTDVVGYGQFLLYANGPPSNYYAHSTNGNDAFCAIYVGPYNIGSLNPGTGGSTGATRVALLQ
jgi:hypothetical protein